MTESRSSSTAPPHHAEAPLVDPGRLSAWIDDRLPGVGPVEVTRHAEGHSNLTFVVRRAGAGADWILRRPPRGPLLPTAHDVVREYRVLDLLARSGSAVRVPRVAAVCEDPDVIGVPFYLMERVPGEVVRDALPPWLADDAAHAHARRALGVDLAEALAELHTAPYQPFVEAGIGKRDGYLERQLRRWRGQREGIEAAVAAAGGQARPLPDYDALRDWLADRLPAAVEPAVVHGDFKLDNVIVTADGPDGPQVAAIVDWEMATVGDPRADLGYLLSFWPEAGEAVPLARLVTVAPGFPRRSELIDRWADRTGREPGDVTWFMTLAVWKLAILLEASYYRHLAGMSDDPFFAELEQGVPALLARARELSGA